MNCLIDMNDWHEVNAAEINPELTEKIDGAKVKISFSPYDVPRRYRGHKIPNSKFYHIDFEYLMEEETKPIAFGFNCPVELEVGVNSQRIYCVRINTALLESDKTLNIQLKPVTQVVNAIHRFKETMPEKLQARYKMPEEIVLKDRLQISQLTK